MPGFGQMQGGLTAYQAASHHDDPFAGGVGVIVSIQRMPGVFNTRDIGFYY
jgi:hypothetical protein